ncbi:hypothetical protein HGQ17_10335 [Nesterenkonia sp. MY13]|uniref:Uncharacterized protein n=1 Tax=Nesterenkonia sedimenti TaxID=1463632 RepID=A0A7X8TL61_9MICC|nr:hypothetical protein [Nesterenkonia sedimenti]NLS10382.1 hypothetical protein [Nesterenkonia sedimenti]
MTTPPNDNTPQWGQPSPQGEDPSTGPKFGTEAYNPQAFGGPVEEPAKFRSLKIFTLVSGGLFLISGVMMLLMFNNDSFREAMIDDLMTTYQEMGVAMERTEVESVYGWFSTGTTIFVLVLLGIYALVYFGLRANKNWARILGIIFAIISIVFSVLGFAMGEINLSMLISLVWLGVNVYWLVLAFNSEVADYLFQHKR